MKKFKILSIDGGGLRGIIPAILLKEIERRSGKRIVEMFDMIAGTSTGGLITCALTVSKDGKTPLYTTEDIVKVYMDRGKEIFPQRNWLNRLINKVTSLKDPKYSGRGLDKVLTEMLGPLKLTDCLKPVFITTYDLNHNEAILFKKRKALGDAFCNALLKDICRATSAGPTYLPAYEFTYENKKRVCIDGGVYMNNPSVGAIVEASKYHEFYGFSEFDDITLLSLGTGHYTKDLVKKKVQGFGQLDWAVPISDVMMQGVNQTTCYMAEELLPAGQFLRLSVDIDEEKYSDMADSSDETRNYLVNKVNKDVIQNRAMMEKLDKFLGNNLA